MAVHVEIYGTGRGFFRRVREISNTGHVRRVSLSVRMEQLGSHLTDFHEIWYLIIFRNSFEKIPTVIKI
jgi:hypothetical protein